MMLIYNQKKSSFPFTKKTKTKKAASFFEAAFDVLSKNILRRYYSYFGNPIDF